MYKITSSPIGWYLPMCMLKVCLQLLWTWQWHLAVWAEKALKLSTIIHTMPTRKDQPL